MTSSHFLSSRGQSVAHITLIREMLAVALQTDTRTLDSLSGVCLL